VDFIIALIAVRHLTNFRNKQRKKSYNKNAAHMAIPKRKRNAREETLSFFAQNSNNHTTSNRFVIRP
jgi:hypothetical protein